MNLYNVKYKNTIYSNIDYPFLIQNKKIIEVYNDIIPFTLNVIYSIEENEEFLILKETITTFNFEKNKPIFKDTTLNRFEFSKITFKCLNDYLTPTEYHSIIKNNVFFEYLTKIINLNENIKNNFNTKEKYLNLEKKPILYCINFYNLIIFNFLEYEKIINSNNISFLEKNLGLNNFKLNESNKLKDVIGIPSFLIKDLKNYKIEEILPNLKKLLTIIDNNSGKMIIDFINNMKFILVKNYLKKQRIYKLNIFLEELYEILSYQIEINGSLYYEYKTNDLLNYLLKQSLFCSNNFNFPFEESNLLKDYLYMNKKYNLKHDKYPNNLKISHNLISKNISILENSDEENEKIFKNTINKYLFLEKEFTYKDKENNVTKTYSVLLPKNTNDLIQEGNNLHHCVGSYSDKIKNEKVIILFLRKKEKLKESYITIAINKDYNLLEAKKNFDKEISDEETKIIKKWLKEIKK